MTNRKSADEELILQRTYNVSQQCELILRQLRSTVGQTTLPMGTWGEAGDDLHSRLTFIMTELNGIRVDTGFDPSAGETTREALSRLAMARGSDDGSDGT